MFEERLAKLREKLKRLEGIMLPEHREILKGRYIMSALYQYCFPMNPPATSEQVKAFESKHNCSLPEDYREFIQQIGDGGPGPNGLFTLFPENNKTRNPMFGAHLAPFPFIWQSEIIPETGEDWGSFTYMEDLEDKTRDIGLAIEFFCGGCDHYYFLVVTGSEKGSVWQARTESNREFAALATGEKTRVSFLEWFENWIEKQLQTSERALARGVPIVQPLRG